MDTYNDISLPVRKRILEDEIQILKNTLYLLSVRVKANKLVGDTNAENEMKTEIEKIMRKIDFVKNELEKECGGISENKA